MNFIPWDEMFPGVASVRTVLPVIFCILVFHLARLACILSIMNWKTQRVGLDWIIGKPNYFPKEILGSILRML